MMPISAPKRCGTSWKTAPLPSPSDSMPMAKTGSARKTEGRPMLTTTKAVAATR